MAMNIEDKKDLQSRLTRFSLGDEEHYKITRIEARYISGLVNEDWRK